MLKLRLQRRGKKNYATYRVVVADQRAPIKGKFIADVGYYNPHNSEFKVSAEEVEKWLSNGAQASATVHNLLIENKVITGEKVTSWRPKAKQEEESSEEESGDKTAPKPEEIKKDDKEEKKTKEPAGDKETSAKEKKEEA